MRKTKILICKNCGEKKEFIFSYPERKTNLCKKCYNKQTSDQSIKKCKVEGCKNKHKANGYCQRHYNQIKQYGKILERTIHDSNEIIDCGDYCEICLYNQKCEEVARTKIDKDDLNKIKDCKWGIDRGGYCINYKIKLHQLILGKKEGFEIDHINHDKLDNRKQNLRFATSSQNNMNRKCKGYYFNKEFKKWCVTIIFDYKVIHLGYFDTEQKAQFIRKEAEIKYFGEFAFKK